MTLKHKKKRRDSLTSKIFLNQGEFCPAKTLSGKPEYGRIFETSGGNMIQEMKYVESDETAAVIKHRVEDNKLVMEMRCRDIVCRSVYKRMQ